MYACPFETHSAYTSLKSVKEFLASENLLLKLNIPFI
jgi:hypothetical protein